MKTTWRVMISVGCHRRPSAGCDNALQKAFGRPGRAAAKSKPLALKEEVHVTLGVGRERKKPRPSRQIVVCAHY